jgi:hypothetical protein
LEEEYLIFSKWIYNNSLSSSVFFYFSCGTEDTVLAWVSSMIIFYIGVLYLLLHFCAGEGYSQSLKEQLNWKNYIY